jgi:hypothetical protein
MRGERRRIRALKGRLGTGRVLKDAAILAEPALQGRDNKGNPGVAR